MSLSSPTQFEDSLNIYAEILKRLSEWEKEEGSLPETVEAYRRVTVIQAEAAAKSTPHLGALPRSKVEEKLREGVPILNWHTLSLDTEAVQGTLLEIARVAVQCGQLNPSDLGKLEQVASQPSLLEEAASLWWQGEPLKPVAGKLSLGEHVLEAIIQAALKPFLAAYAHSLVKLVEQEEWRRGYCPVCGGPPDFAYLDRERGARWLLCSRCDAQWLFQRLECPYCGNQDQDALSYYSDDSGLYRLYMCDKCLAYLKVIDLRQTESQVILPLERILTADMDRQGGEGGYHPGWLPKTPPTGD